MLETRAISQMKALLILIKSHKKTFVNNKYLPLSGGHEGRKWPENHEIGPISNLESVKNTYSIDYKFIRVIE